MTRPHPRPILTAALPFSIATLAACTTPHVASDYDHTAPFASYHSFTLIERPHPAATNPIAVQRTYDAIKADLTIKGFTYVPGLIGADFVVDFTVGVSDRLSLSTYPASYSGPWGFGPGLWGNQVDLRQYHEGSLAIDVFDVRHPRPIWHGNAEKELSRVELEHSEQPVQEAVTAVLADFPPKPNSRQQ